MAGLAAILTVFFLGIVPSFVKCYDARHRRDFIGQPSSFAELGAVLSPDASILFPEDPRFGNAILRWQAYSAPSFRAVVKVATEVDIQKTVRFANQHSIPFLATGGAHGFVPTLGRLQNGIEIRTRNMRSIEISNDFARLGPGFTNGELIRALWAKHKRTVTGSCMCSGMMGVTLGGGHGIIQGQYGLAADQLLEARLVLANGSAITVSPKSHSDLFWALKGVGHNFGILSELKFKIYPGGSPWTRNEMFFRGDKVEQFFAEANKLTEEANHPPELMHLIIFGRRPDIDPDNVVISSILLYEGPEEKLERFTAPFRKIGPVSERTATSVQYPDLFDLNGQMEDDPPCYPDLNRHLMPVRLREFNLSAQREVYNIFNNLTTNPGFAGTAYLFEGYPKQGVVAVPEESTAVPFRQEQLLTSPLLTYADDSLSGVAIAAGKEMRKILLKSSASDELHAYVNYAFGDEPLRALYGYEPWRTSRLKSLKRKYDPDGSFNYYAPII